MRARGCQVAMRAVRFEARNLPSVDVALDKVVRALDSEFNTNTPLLTTLVTRLRRVRSIAPLPNPECVMNSLVRPRREPCEFWRVGNPTRHPL
jgi:hypothetical protein